MQMADVLHDISLIARPGETTAIIGSTGCGTSTLINLIPGFMMSRRAGMVDGVDVRDVAQEDLRKKIGYIAQKASSSRVDPRHTSPTAIRRI